MNPPPKPTREAILRFSTPDYEFIKVGDHVRCAVTGAPIPLEALNYWSVELQEAYASAEAMTQRWRETR